MYKLRVLIQMYKLPGERTTADDEKPSKKKDNSRSSTADDENIDDDIEFLLDSDDDPEFKDMVAKKYPANAGVHRPFLFNNVLSSKIKNTAYLKAAFSFLSNVALERFKQSELEEACGIDMS